MCCPVNNDLENPGLNGFQKAVIVTGIVAAVAAIALVVIFASPFLPAAAASVISAAVALCGGFPVVPITLISTFAACTVGTIFFGTVGANFKKLQQLTKFDDV